MLDEFDVERERIIATLTEQRDRALHELAIARGRSEAEIRLSILGEIAPSP